MSILIKGMEMPTDCHNCPLGFGGGCYCGTSADEYVCPDHGRAKWCPLVPVPPHGRLIEKNAVFELIRSFQNVDRQLSVEFMKALFDLPTIIPASEEGE